MKNSRNRAIPSKIAKEINKAYPDTNMGDWCKRNHRRAYQEIGNANNTKEILFEQSYKIKGYWR